MGQDDALQSVYATLGVCLTLVLVAIAAFGVLWAVL